MEKLSVGLLATQFSKWLELTDLAELECVNRHMHNVICFACTHACTTAYISYSAVLSHPIISRLRNVRAIRLMPSHIGDGAHVPRTRVAQTMMTMLIMNNQSSLRAFDSTPDTNADELKILARSLAVLSQCPMLERLVLPSRPCTYGDNFQSDEEIKFDDSAWKICQSCTNLRVLHFKSVSLPTMTKILRLPLLKLEYVSLSNIVWSKPKQSFQSICDAVLLHRHTLTGLKMRIPATQTTWTCLAQTLPQLEHLSSLTLRYDDRAYADRDRDILYSSSSSPRTLVTCKLPQLQTLELQGRGGGGIQSSWSKLSTCPLEVIANNLQQLTCHLTLEGLEIAMKRYPKLRQVNTLRRLTAPTRVAVRFVA